MVLGFSDSLNNSDVCCSYTIVVTLSHTSSNLVYVNSSCCAWYKLFSEGGSSLIAALGLYKSENGWMIEFIAGLCFEIAERKSICSISDGGVHSSIRDDPDAEKPEEPCFVARVSSCGNSEQGMVSSYKCAPFFLLQLICGLGIEKGKSASFEYGTVSTMEGSFHWHSIWVQLLVARAEDSK